MRFNTAPGPEYVYREFRRSDGEIEGIDITHPIFGGTMEKDGVPVAYAGVNLIAGRHWAFFFIKDDNLRKTLWLMRLMRDSIAMLKNGGITELYVLCDTRIPRATEFLTALKFRKLTEDEKPIDVMVYEGLMGAKAWRMDLA